VPFEPVEPDAGAGVGVLGGTIGVAPVGVGTLGVAEGAARGAGVADAAPGDGAAPFDAACGFDAGASRPACFDFDGSAGATGVPGSS
jgi:hypothetical protein